MPEFTPTEKDDAALADKIAVLCNDLDAKFSDLGAAMLKLGECEAEATAELIRQQGAAFAASIGGAL